jgi:hypothetical protein
MRFGAGIHLAGSIFAQTNSGRLMPKSSIRALIRFLTNPVSALWLSIAVAAYCAAMPFYRAAMFLEIKYNEGWNAYNATTLAHHATIYPARYAWTMANYPVLSFFTIAQLGRFTHDYVYTGRFLSLLGLVLSCVFAGIIVQRITTSRRTGLLAALLCLTLFCTNAHTYVGVDDPQLFAQAFFMAGLLLYVVYRDRPSALIAVALLFVIGGNIKHNLIDFPLALSIELFLVSRRRLAFFIGLLALFEVPAFYLNLHLGGPFFLDQLLIPRRYFWDKPFTQSFDYYIVLLIPMAAALYAAARSFRVPQRRVIAIYFAVSLIVGVYFSGGEGVSINAYFSNTLALAMILGFFLQDFGVPHPRLSGTAVQWNSAATLILFFWMLIPLQCDDALFPLDNWHKLHAQQQRFTAQVDFLRAHPGPALCESILRCYYADKPYVVDPFNSASLIHAGKLDENVLVSAIQAQQFSAIQFNKPPLASGRPDAPPERFTPAVLQAVQQNYTLGLQNSDCTIYVPAHQPQRALR